MNIKELNEQILRLCAKNLKLNAVKLYKDTMDAGLAESKDYVDNLVANALKNPYESQFLEENNLENKVIILIQKGQKLQAIKLYLDNTNCSLLESKNYVENLAERKGLVEQNNLKKVVTTNTKPNNYLIIGFLFVILIALVIFFASK